MIYYGRRLNMSRQEIMVTRYGEMKDMITCLQIEKGELVPVQKKGNGSGLIKDQFIWMGSRASSK